MKRDKLIKEIIEKDSFIFEDPCPLSHQELEEIDSTIESTSSMLDNMKIDSTEDDPMLRFEKIVENLNKSNKSMGVKRNELIFLKDYHNTSKTPCSDWLDHKRVDLYPINENTEILQMHQIQGYGIFLKVIMLLIEIWINFQISLFIFIFSE